MIDYETNNNNHQNIPSSSSSDPLTHKRKRRPAGTPDPEAEVISLSPRTLLESDRYICEICSQGFQRDQNLQMHRRRHKVPWKLLKREKKEEEVIKKRVYVCPEPTCLHHDPCHALGDLVGIKKHYRRKHSVHKQWVCQRCSKAYAVQSDYKAHLKTCGSRGHSCDCGRVFSRVESFIEHQDNCTIRRSPATNHRQDQPPATATPSTNGDLNIGPLLYGLPLLKHHSPAALNSQFNNTSSAQSQSLELQLKPYLNSDEIHETSLNLWIGTDTSSSRAVNPKEKADEEMQKAEEARREAKRQREMAETEFENAKRLRKEAKAELEKAHVLREEAIKRINATMMHITCHSCKVLFHVPLNGEDTTTSSLAVSSATTEGECL